MVPANFEWNVHMYVKNIYAQLQSWGFPLRCTTGEDAQIAGKTGHITNEDQPPRNIIFTAKNSKKFIKYRYQNKITKFEIEVLR